MFGSYCDTHTLICLPVVIQAWKRCVGERFSNCTERVREKCSNCTERVCVRNSTIVQEGSV